MRKKRLVLASLLSAVLLLVAVEPVAAQTSTTAELINELNGKLLYIAIPITLLVEVILFYTVWRFRNNDDPVPTQENRRLEITWTIATAIILLFVGVASYGVLANPNITYTPDSQNAQLDDNTVVVKATAYQWGWDISYPNENLNKVTNSEGDPVIVLPKGQDVVIRVTSRDVLHALHVPELGLKQDAFPGEVNSVKTKPLKEGTYQGYCAEFCGVAHSNMYLTVDVRSQQEYQTWLQQQKQSQQKQNGGNSGNSSDGGNSSAVSQPPAALLAVDGAR